VGFVVLDDAVAVVDHAVVVVVIVGIGRLDGSGGGRRRYSEGTGRNVQKRAERIYEGLQISFCFL